MVEPLVIIGRDEWGALPAKVGDILTHPVNILIEDYLPLTVPEGEEELKGLEECQTQEECMERVRDLQKEAFREEHRDIKYNFMIGNDGNIYEGRGWDKNTNDTHPELKSLVIGYLGNYFPAKVQLPPKIIEAKDRFIKYAQQQKLLTQDYINWTLKEKIFKKDGDEDSYKSGDRVAIRKYIQEMTTDEDVRKNGPQAELIFVDTEPEEEPKDPLL